MKSDIRILIVEDEAITAKGIESQIRKMGYRDIDIAISYNKAIRSIKENRPDLILLDINLKSSYSGIDIANTEEVLNQIPIIYLTGCTTDSQMVKDLVATNPIAFIPKPIKDMDKDLQEAISLALAEDEKSGIVEIGEDYSYDFETEKLFYKREFIKLSKNERLLLERLIMGKGEVVEAEKLEFEIWEYEVRAKSSLRTLVGSLRKKLNPKMIVNIPFFGYKLNIPKDKI